MIPSCTLGLLQDVSTLAGSNRGDSTGVDLGGGVTRVTSHPRGAAAYFMLLLCVWLKLFRCRSVPLLEPNPGDATAPRSYVQLLYRPLKFHSLVSPDPLNARSLRSLGFPKSPPPLKNPRSANAVRDHIFGTTSSPNLCSCYLWLCPPLTPSGVVTCYMYVFPVLWMTSH